MIGDFAPGEVIDGRYRVISRLGAGGMADVYLAEDTQLSRNVALKLLHRRFAEDPGFVERFRREAQAAASLQHPNVVGVYDRGSFDGTYYIAMEYLPGRSLKQLIRQEAPLDPVRAIDITLQILRAARFAHRRGVIHRDLKPHNVIIDDSDNAKVTDFGIARAGASDMTETGSIMGTAQYLSPEQAQGHAVSEPSDLYAVGVVLYEMLTARVPFEADSAVTIALKHVSEAPPAPREINPAIPAALEQVVQWALNKNPADRPADADQFIAVLEQAREAIVSGHPGQVTASMAAVVAAGELAPMATGPTTVMPAPADLGPYGPAPYPGDDGTVQTYVVEDRDPGRSVWPWLLALLILLLLAGGAAVYLLTRPTLAVVPTVVGDQLSVAQAQVQNRGFTPNVIPEASPNPAGVVIDQSPLGGAKRDQGSTVTLTVSQGPGDVNVPPVDSLSEKAAEALLRRKGLKVAGVVPASSNTVAKGYALRTDPGAGASLQPGSSVTLYISSGPAGVHVPDVTGDTAQQAKSTLSQAGFIVNPTDQPSSTVQPGTVISQTPSGGSTAPTGSAVTLVIATAPATASIPNVVGDTAAAAAANLKSAGFNVTQQTKTVAAQNENGLVISESPQAQTTAKKGSQVTIVVGKYSPRSTNTTTTPLNPKTTTTPASTTTTTTSTTP